MSLGQIFFGAHPIQIIEDCGLRQAANNHMQKKLHLTWVEADAAAMILGQTWTWRHG